MRNDKGVPLGNIANVLLSFRAPVEWHAVLGHVQDNGCAYVAPVYPVQRVA
jgi:hypothetical protein